MKELSLKLKSFLISLYLFTLITVIICPSNKIYNINQINYTEIIFFGIILAIAESFRIAYKGMAISTSLSVLVATSILFGTFATSVIILIGFSLRFRKTNDKYYHVFNQPIYQTLFNFCAQILPIVYAGLVYSKFGGTFNATNLWGKFYLIIIFSVVYLLLNTFLISLLFSLLNDKNPLFFFLSNIRLSLLSGLVMTPFGVLLAYLYRVFGYIGVLYIIFPIVLVRYTFSLYIESKNQYIQTVDTLMHAMEARDKYTEGHSQRVAEIAKNIARALRYSDSKVERLHMAALLHDVGKIGIDDKILNKPGKLTNEEYEIIKSHPEIGYNILKDIKNLQDLLPIVRNHHERYDGKGYPDGKSGNDLSLDVFIVQLADSIDAMSTDRPYRKALSEEEIMAEINRFRGSQFHPKVVDAYTKILEQHKEQKAV